MPDRPAGIWMDHDAGYLGSKGNRTLLAHAVNVSDVSMSISPVYDSNLVAWRNATKSHWRQVDNVAAFDRPIVTHQLHLTQKKDVEQEIRLSLDELLPANAPRDGVYRVNLTSSAASALPYPSMFADDEEEDSWHPRL